MREILVDKVVHFDTNSFISIMFEHGCTKFRTSQKAIVDPLKTPLDASLSQIMGNMMFSLFWSFPISVAMRSSLLTDIILNWEKVQCVLDDASISFTFFQEMPACAIDDASLQYDRHSLHCVLGSVSNNSASRQTTGLPVLSWFVSSSTLKLVRSWEERVWEAPCAWLVSRQTTGFRVLSCFTSFSWKERVSISWERNVFLASCKWLASRQTTGFPDLSWSGFGFGWLNWEPLDCRTTSPSGCRATSEPNSFIQSCFKEIFGGGRGDMYTFPYMTSPVSILTTFGIQ